MDREQNMNSHFVQNARLKQFARKEGDHFKLTVVDLKRNKIGSRNTNRAFYLKGLYPNDVEWDLKVNVEDPGMKVFDKVYKSRGVVMLTRSELETMKKYLLIQLYRNPTNMATYSPFRDDDYFGFNKEFKNDAEANLHVADEMKTICNKPWSELGLTEDRELLNNLWIMNNTKTMFVKSESLEFVINDLGSVTERHPYHMRDAKVTKQFFEEIVGIKATDEQINLWLDKHQYYDNFTFYPISSRFGVTTLNTLWTQLFRFKDPFTFKAPSGPGRLFDVEVDGSFFKWAFREHGIYSNFIQELYVPCVQNYKSEKLRNPQPGENFLELIGKYKSPEDEFYYPVVDLDLEWAEYLNRLTINEADRYFGFGSNDDGELSIGNYEVERLMYCKPGEAKHDLSWIGPKNEWTQPLN